MKKWNNPELEVLGVEETKYGSDTVTEPDGTYVDPVTKDKYYAWAAESGKTEGQN